MKNVSSWKFSAPLSHVDVPRILAEAYSPEALGVVRITVDEAEIVLSRAANMVGKVNVPGAAGYLTPDSKVVWLSDDPDGEVQVTNLDSINFDGDPDSMAVFYPESANDADQLVGDLVDRVVVNVEVF